MINRDRILSIVNQIRHSASLQNSDSPFDKLNISFFTIHLKIYFILIQMFLSLDKQMDSLSGKLFFTLIFMKSQINTNFQKKLKDYVISYCQTQLYGKNIHGEMRTGYKSKQNKIVIFRIVPLPLTPQLTEFLQLQQHYSALSNYARTVHEPLHSSSNHYVPLQFFPKTFHSQQHLFKSNAKYMDEYVQKFLRTYSFFYNMRVPHGNLTAQNIGITFEGKVKLMDFSVQKEDQKFEQKAQKDFFDFKSIISIILQKDDHFPSKFASFNSPQTHNWQHLFSNWHITSPLEPVYLPRKNYIDNILTLLYKLEDSLNQSQHTQHLKIGIRLLMLSYLQLSKQEEHLRQIEALEDVVGRLDEWDYERFNGVLMGAIKDPQYYGLNAQQRLVLISCLITKLNHEYIYFETINQFKSQQTKRNQLLGDSLFAIYRFDILNNLIKPKH